MAQNPAAQTSEQIFELGLSFGETVRGVLYRQTPPQPVEADWMKAASMGMFAAGYKFYRSASELIRLGFEESAAVINRTIFDLSLQARFLQRNPDRIADYMHWAEFNQFRIVRRCMEHEDEYVRSLADVAESPGHEQRVRELEAHYNEHKQRYQKRKDVWHGLRTDKLAKACGEDATRDYAVMHWHDSNLVHANPTGMGRFVKIDVRSRRIKLLVDPSPPEQDWVAWRSTQNFLFIVYALRVAWGFDLDIESVDRALNEIIQRR